MNWSETPFIRLVIPFILGISCAIIIDKALPAPFFFLTAVFIVLLFLIQKFTAFQYRFLFGGCVTLFLFLAGYQLTFQNNEMRKPSHFSYAQNQEKNVFLLKINEIPSIDKWVKASVKIQSINQQSATGNLLLYLERDSFSEQLAYGDLLAFNGQANLIDAPKNPYQFDYQQYLYFQNIHHQAFVRAADWGLVATSQGDFFHTSLFHLRKKSLSVLEKYLSPESYAVGAALILGYREVLSEDVQAAYTDTGAIHVLAVSGLHVGIVAAIFVWIFGFLSKKKKSLKWLSTALTILSLWLFALLTGGSPSVIRATTMFSLVVIARAIKYPSSIYNTLAISALLMLLYDPYLIKSVGFQLSYLAVLSIVYFQPQIARLLHVPTLAGRYIWSLTAVSLAAQIGTLPLTLFYFHQFPTLFWLSGLIVIPLAGIILSLGLATLFLEIISPPLAKICGAVLDFFIWIMNKGIISIQKFPIGKIEGISLSSVAMFLLFMLIGTLIFIIHTTQKQRTRGVLAFLTISLLLFSTSSFQILQQSNKQQIVVYNLYKNSVIAFIDGQTSYRFQSADIPQKAIDFGIKSHETALHINQKEIMPIGTPFKNEAIYSNGNIVFFNKKICLIIDNQIDINTLSGTKTTFDYVFLTGNPKIYLQDIAEKIDFKMLIIDASNSRQKTTYWETDAAELGINCYNVVNGAWLETL